VVTDSRLLIANLKNGFDGKNFSSNKTKPKWYTSCDYLNVSNLQHVFKQPGNFLSEFSIKSIFSTLSIVIELNRRSSQNIGGICLTVNNPLRYSSGQQDHNTQLEFNG
jgi:hypothetical protein